MKQLLDWNSFTFYKLLHKDQWLFSTNVNFKALLHYTAYAKRYKIITSFISTFPIDCLKFKLCISQYKLNLLKKISFAANVFANAELMCHSGNKVSHIDLKYILFPISKTYTLAICMKFETEQQQKISSIIFDILVVGSE